MVKKTFNPKSLLQSSFQPTLLDAPLGRRRRIKNKQIYFEPLPKSLQPTPYVPPKPTPPPRKKKRPIPLPRAEKARAPDPRVQKLIVSQKDPRKLFSLTQNDITQELAQLLQQRVPFKAYLTLQVELKKSFTKDGEVFFEFTQPYFNSSARAI